jgi:DNA-binding transcriptional MocR family regulator
VKRTKITAAELAQKLGDWQQGRGALKVRLKSRLAEVVLNGELVGGDRLPPERGLAQALAVSRNTVVGAYELLREDGYLATRRASGSVVQLADGGERVQHRRASLLSKTVTLPEAPLDRNDIVDFAVAHTDLPYAFERYVEDAAVSKRGLLRADSYDPYGLPDLREAIAAYCRARGVPAIAEEILITSGGQQAISLILSLYVQRGDAVGVQNPTFFVALDALRMAGARLFAIPSPVERDALRDSLLQRAARMLYVIPTHHNPTGATLGAAEREAIAHASESFAMPVIEDITLDELGYDGFAPSPIAALAPHAPVLLAGSLNKVFWSGLRVGWIRAPRPILTQLARLKTVADLGGNALAQTIALNVLADFEEIRRFRRDALHRKMLHAVDLLSAQLPEWQFEIPEGGFCLWLRLPVADARPYVQLARRFGVNIIAGSSMTFDDSCTNQLRLVFSGSGENTEEGIRRLAAAWEAYRPRTLTGTAAADQLVV